MFGKLREHTQRQKVEQIDDFIIKQTNEACKTGYVTIRGQGKIPVWCAFRCLYCGEYFSQSSAEKHFGKTRFQHQRDKELK